MKLVIANKNYSSWSLRAWLVLKELGIPFTEEKTSFNAPHWKQDISKLSPSGTVPILVDGQQVIWDTLAITEYVAEKYPDYNIWPKDPAARAYARSVCAEMHSGFGALRQHMPMNIEARLPGMGWNMQVQANIDRILQIWLECRTKWASAGPMLFGDFCAADAFYAPVVWRFVTHSVSVPPVAKVYMDAVQNLSAMKAWEEEALAEKDFVSMDEPYRPHP